MVTIHCSSGPQALQAFVKKMKENTRRFSDEYQVNQDSTFNQPRPLMIGVTIPYYMESTISAMIFGNIGQRLLVLDGYLRQLDGVICRPDNIKSYDKTIRMVTEVVPGEQPLADTQKKKITPAKAIEQGADYLLIREPITSPLPGHTTKSETERILVEIANSLQNRDRLKKVDQPLKPIRRMSVKDENATPPKTAAKKTEKSRETTQEKAPEQAVMAAIDVEKKTSNKPPQRRIFQRPRYLRQLFARS
jgi:hypothetical protein